MADNPTSATPWAPRDFPLEHDASSADVPVFVQSSSWDPDFLMESASHMWARLHASDAECQLPMCGEKPQVRPAGCQHLSTALAPQGPLEGRREERVHLVQRAHLVAAVSVHRLQHSAPAEIASPFCRQVQYWHLEVHSNPQVLAHRGAQNKTGDAATEPKPHRRCIYPC